MKIRIATAGMSRPAVGLVAGLARSRDDLRLIAAWPDPEAALNGLNGRHADILLVQYKGTPDDAPLSELAYLHPTLGIILVTSKFPEALALRSRRITGLAGWLSFGNGKDTLEKAIRTVAAGREFTDAFMKEQIARLENSRRPSLAVVRNLSETEIKVLDLLSREYSASEISLELCMPRESAEDIRDSLMIKLGAESTATLVRCAASAGLL